MAEDGRARGGVSAEWGDDLAPIERAIAIMELLRSPDGCPWDREQTFDTIRRHTLEETYEVFDAIERRSWGELRDELGDLLLQVLFYAQMAKEAGYFDMKDVARGLNAKLIRRHPHIFKDGDAASGGDVEAEDSATVLRNWEAIKREERRGTTEAGRPMLEAVPRSMPAVVEASKLGAKAAKVGFDWPDATGMIAKVREETAEIEAELAGGEPRAIEEEVGDLLFTAVNLARHAGVDAEFALRGANAKFRRRFGWMERAAGGAEALAGKTPEALDELWRRAKGEAGEEAER